MMSGLDRTRGSVVAGGRMDRYVGAGVLKAQAVVVLCLLTVVTLFTVVDELQDGTAGYSAQHALLYVLYSTPRRLYELMPYAVFLGSLAGLGILAGNEEVTVLRAAGVSVARLFGAAAAPALLVLAGNQLLGEFVAPAGETEASALKLAAQRGGDDTSGAFIKASAWHREGGLYTSIDGYGRNGELIGVRQYRLQDGRLTLSRAAARARFVAGQDAAPGTASSKAVDGAPAPGAASAEAADVGHWRLEDVVETRLLASGTSVRRHDALAWHTAADPVLLSAKALIDPAKLSFRELAAQIDYQQREGLDAARYQVAFWGKALQPVAVLGLVLLAVGFVVGPMRESGMGARLALGVAVGLAYKYLVDIFAPMSVVFEVPPWLAMAMPVAVCWLAGAVLVRRV